MPSTENKTLERIQREIMDVMEREKELRTLYNHNNNNNNNEPQMNGNGIIKTNGNDLPLPPLTRAQSTSVLTDEATNGSNQRRFATNPNNKGVMQKFFKARGKLANIQTLQMRQQPTQFNIPDFTAPKVIVEPGKKIRNGFIPVEERMRKEIQEAHNREIELRSIRRKSQPDLQAALDLEMELEASSGNGLRSTKSMLQLYDPDEDESRSLPAPCSLKPALSLAALCDAVDEEIQSPQSLIMQFEQMIIKNQQARA